MKLFARTALASLLLCVGCSRACAAPEPQGDDPSPSLDAAPASGEVPSRCVLEREIAVQGTDVELGRMTLQGTRALVGARHDGQAAIAELDVAQPNAQVRFVDLAPAVGEVPPPMPLIAGDKAFSVGYERDVSKRLRLVLRDLAAPSSPAAELAPEPADDSLAFDALAGSGRVLVAWDAPAEEGSAVFVTSLVAGAKPAEPVRVSPAGADADTPRLAPGAAGPVVLYASHRALPKSDAAALPEGPGQDPEHVWVAMQPTGPDGRPAGPATNLTAESGAIATYDVVSRPQVMNEAPHGVDFDLIATDGVELGAGQGGKLLLVAVRNGSPAPSITIAEHVGRGAPALFPGSPSVLLFSDPSERGRSSLLGDSPTAFEPALDGARPLGVIPSVAPASLRILAVAAPAGAERARLRLLRCAAR
ncbi:MAG TPA: hypothetical protein VLM85_03320 [Polyangiaceae bacterium]|nr:hypothetical protein [Polyangiaceae bacterium]